MFDYSRIFGYGKPRSNKSQTPEESGDETAKTRPISLDNMTHDRGRYAQGKDRKAKGEVGFFEVPAECGLERLGKNAPCVDRPNTDVDADARKGN